MNTTPSTISEYRAYLNETLLPSWISSLRPQSIVIDIGKSTTWNYERYFNTGYFTLDRDWNLFPDIIHDMELSPLQNQVDAILLNGVFEQCDDPFALIRNVHKSLKPDGRLLAGLASINMKPYGERDKWRITRAGIRPYLRNFFIDEIIDTFSGEYFYVCARKI